MVKHSKSEMHIGILRMALEKGGKQILRLDSTAGKVSDPQACQADFSAIRVEGSGTVECGPCWRQLTEVTKSHAKVIKRTRIAGIGFNGGGKLGIRCMSGIHDG